MVWLTRSLRAFSTFVELPAPGIGKKPVAQSAPIDFSFFSTTALGSPVSAIL
ncbi:hypothetical protein PDO_1096 [Rhizobium sp. PDO1-076]|nr:hypothetical protein PDO_1096 [Rhizobium sp. PDO1-076]